MDRTNSLALLLLGIAAAASAPPAAAQDRFVFSETSLTGFVSGDWKLVPIDYPGDGVTDLFLNRPTGTSRLMLGTNDSAAFSFETWPAGPLNATTQLHTGDFNNDGLTDLFVFDASTGGIQVGIRSGTSYLFSSFSGALMPPTGWSFAIGDFTNDGYDDVAGYYEPAGQIWIGANWGTTLTWSLASTVFPATGWKFVADRFVVGVDTLVGFHPSNDTLWQAPLVSLQFSFSPWGNTSAGGWQMDQLLSGDFNRDGRADVLGYDAATRELLVGLSNGSSFEVARWGEAPSAGNWRFAVGAFSGVAPQPDVVGFETGTQTIWMGDNVQRQCSNGFDDDQDGQVDHPADVRCQSPADNNEKSNPSCGLGAELALVLALLRRRASGGRRPDADSRRG